MIINGKRTTGIALVAERGERIPFSIALSGVTIKTIYTFEDYGYLYEILVKVPDLAAASNIILSLHDKDYQMANDARYISPLLAKNATHVIRGENLIMWDAVVPFKISVAPGDTIRVVTDTGADVDIITGVMRVVTI